MLSDLPLLNALLNTASAILLVVGHRQLKKGNIQLHKRLMLSAFVVSCVFLTSYLIYHYEHGSQPFPGQGALRYLYFTILISHIILAASIVPLAVITLKRGLKREDNKHRRIAKWTYPIWLYVSISGVIIYLMLYQLFPS